MKPARRTSISKRSTVDNSKSASWSSGNCAVTYNTMVYVRLELWDEDGGWNNDDFYSLLVDYDGRGRLG